MHQTIFCFFISIIFWGFGGLTDWFVVYCMGVTIISNVRALLLLIERHVTRFQAINVYK